MYNYCPKLLSTEDSNDYMYSYCPQLLSTEDSNDYTYSYCPQLLSTEDSNDYTYIYMSMISIYQKVRIYFSDHGIRTRGPILWNSMTKPIKESKSFRNQLKRNLIGKYDVCIF